MSMICDEFGCEGELAEEPATPAETAHWQRLEAERRDGYREAGLSEAIERLSRTLADGLAVERRAA